MLAAVTAVYIIGILACVADRPGEGALLMFLALILWVGVDSHAE